MGVMHAESSKLRKPQLSFVQTLEADNMKARFFEPHLDSFQGLLKVSSLFSIFSYNLVFVMHKNNVCKMEPEALRASLHVEFFE